MFVVTTFLPFSFCALVFPLFPSFLLFDVGVNGVEFSGLFSDFTTTYFTGKVSLSCLLNTALCILVWAFSASFFSSQKP